MSMSTLPLPEVILSTTIRLTQKGESHGSLFFANLQTGEFHKAVDWADQSIDFGDRGRDRGLRGIAIEGERIYIASSCRIHVFDPQFHQIDVLENRYLHNIHEITIDDGRLYVASTGFNSILVADLKKRQFVEGYWIRLGKLGRFLRRFNLQPVPSVTKFDPNSTQGPPPGGHLHLNSVSRCNGKTYASGTRMKRLLELHETRGKTAVRIPYLTHNAQVFEDGAILNDTSNSRLAILDRAGRFKETYEVPKYDPSELINANLTPDLARQGFARGLVILKSNLLVAGSSPASVAVFERGNSSPIQSIMLCNDMREAVNGIEVWPFAHIPKEGRKTKTRAWWTGTESRNSQPTTTIAV